MGAMYPTTFRHRLAGVALACACMAMHASCTGEIKASKEDGARGGTDRAASAEHDAVDGTQGSSSAARGAGAARKGGSPSAPGIPDADACKDAQPDPGPAPLLRLSRQQYLNSIRDLFGSVDGVETALGGDADAYELGLVQADVAPVELDSYAKAAETVASFVTSDAKRLDALAPCAAGNDARGCARSFVERFGARVYRAPLAGDADVERHLKLFDADATTDYAHGIALVLSGMLQAPRFLYRVEIGTGDPNGPNAVKLSGYEVASRLSYTLWNSTPDDALHEAADRGDLDTSRGVSDELAAMLKDAKGAHALRAFLERWLQLPRLDSAVKDETLFPEWTSTGL